MSKGRGLIVFSDARDREASGVISVIFQDVYWLPTIIIINATAWIACTQGARKEAWKEEVGQCVSTSQESEHGL